MSFIFSLTTTTLPLGLVHRPGDSRGTCDDERRCCVRGAYGATMESEVVLSIGTAGSDGESRVGVDGFDFDLPTRNKSKNGVEGFLVVGEAEAKSSGEGFECAGGRK